MPRLDMRWGVAMAVMVVAMPAPAFGQRLLETDGIELRGTARVVTYAASLCNVLEASHTKEEYERIKASRWMSGNWISPSTTGRGDGWII